MRDMCVRRNIYGKCTICDVCVCSGAGMLMRDLAAILSSDDVMLNMISRAASLLTWRGSTASSSPSSSSSHDKGAT